MPEKKHTRVSVAELGPKFDDKGDCHLKDCLNNHVILTEKVWNEHLKNHPEREWYKYNWRQIKEALENPDEKRRSRSDRNTKLWYKKIDKVWMSESYVRDKSGFWCVVVRFHDRIKSIYFTTRIKPGDKA